MADFRKWFYALAVVALLAGLSIPASAQIGGTAVTCNNGGATTPIVRSQGLTELVGDLVLNCNGGSPTLAGQTVPPVNITVILSVNITSKLTQGGLYNEALLIIDEPNQSAPGPNSNRPILNCGNTGAPDSGVQGPGICSIISDGNPNNTYNGTPNRWVTPAGVVTTCGGGGPAVGTYGCGTPNVFQGRQGNPFNTGLINNISFLGVPVDPPGTSTTRILRFTNIRGNATQDAVASTFIQVPITAQVAINGSTAFSINVPAQGQVVAYVQNGLIVTAPVTNLQFLQCNTENGKLATGSSFVLNASPWGGPSGGGANGPFGLPVIDGTATGSTPIVRFQEGFASSFKVKNFAQILGNGVFTGAGWNYTGTLNYPPDVNQNVPGAIYNTEAGFEYNASFANPNPNPPNGVGNGPATGATNTGFPLASVGPNVGGVNTGISNAGIATQGTRLFMSFTNVPTGASIFVPPVVYLYRQNDATGTNSFTVTGANTGVAVLVSTDAAGDTAYNPATSGFNLQPVNNNLAVYEILFESPTSLEQVDIPVVVAYVSNLSANPPLGLPVPNQVSQVTGGFAPFYTSASAALPASTSAFPIPRFLPGNAPLNLFEIVKCSCNTLFPFVASTGGFDTGIAIANTSLDPGATFGFGATPQQGVVQFFYFGVGNNGAAPPASQSSGVVPAGQVLTYVLSSGGGAIGTSANGLDNRAAGFEGYIIAQSGFQFCHSFAFISALGAGPTSTGISEGYLGLILDQTVLHRTGQAAEALLH